MRKAWLGKAILACAALYMAALAVVFAVMHQTPDAIARFMGRLGPVPFLLFPFETLWTSARAGHLRPGDPAPDFTLPRLDRAGSVRLSSSFGKRPVVLVFGSYT